jgi:hypothetical protein
MLAQFLESLRSLPKRHVFAWIGWGIGAVVLIGTALILSPGNSLGAVFRVLPRWHQIIDIIWGALGVLLIGWGLLAQQMRFRHKIEDQLDQLNAKVDMLLASQRGGNTFITEFRLPAPRPESNIGWVGAVTDTLKTKSLGAVDEKKVKELFAPVAEPAALVNAALARHVTIKRVVMNTPAGRRSATPHRVEVHVTNNTASALTLSIPKGQVFENATRRERVQNLVVAESVMVKCAPKVTSSVKLPAYCLNRDLKPPNNSSGNITPLKVKFEFKNQRDVWAAVKEHTA